MAGTLSVQTIQGLATAPDPTTVSIPAGYKLVGTDTGSVYAPGGVLQIVHGTLSSTFTATGTAGTFPLDNYFVLPGIEATITPKASNSKILITTHIYAGQSTTATGYQIAYQILKAGAVLTDAQGDAEGGRLGVAGLINDYGDTSANQQYHVNMLSGTHLDTNVGTTSAVTYQIRMRGYSGTTVIYVNRSQAFQLSSTNYDNVPQSTITLTEIAQ